MKEERLCEVPHQVVKRIMAQTNKKMIKVQTCRIEIFLEVWTQVQIILSCSWAKLDKASEISLVSLLKEISRQLLKESEQKWIKMKTFGKTVRNKDGIRDWPG